MNELGMNIGFAVLCLVAAIMLWKFRMAFKLQLILWLLAGAGMTSGVIGGGIRDGVAWALESTNAAVTWGFGQPAPGLLAIAATVAVAAAWMGKFRHKLLPVILLCTPLTWHMTGGIFSAPASLVGNIGGAIGYMVEGGLGV